MFGSSRASWDSQLEMVPQFEGFPLMFLIVQWGAGEVFQYAPWLFGVLTVLSLVYVLWLAMKLFKLGTFAQRVDLFCDRSK